MLGWIQDGARHGFISLSSFPSHCKGQHPGSDPQTAIQPASHDALSVFDSPPTTTSSSTPPLTQG